MMLRARQDRFARPLPRKRYRYIAVALLSTGLMFVGLATAWASDEITLDFVRHGQSVANADGIIDTNVPGTPLTALGDSQAIAVGQTLYNNGDNNIDAVYASELLRTQQTAWPLTELLQGNPDYNDIPNGPTPILDPSQILPGLNEIGAGIYNGYPELSPAGLLYAAPIFLWTLGILDAPIPGSTDPNGIVFDNSFSGAVQTMFDNTPANGVDVPFSSEGAIEAWTQLNVNNPDPLLLIIDPLKNAGQVVVTGDPTEGWTLTDWNGLQVPAASLLTELFVDVRNLIEAPQLAGYNIYEAFLTGDPTTIVHAILTGFGQVGAATLQFPVAVISDLVKALLNPVATIEGIVADVKFNFEALSSGGITGLLGGSDSGGLLSSFDAPLSGFSLGDLSTELAHLLPTTATGLAGLLPGELGTLVGDLFTSI